MGKCTRAHCYTAFFSPQELTGDQWIVQVIKPDDLNLIPRNPHGVSRESPQVVL